jgi:translation initiation factor 6 (eIF-6)
MEVYLFIWSYCQDMKKIVTKFGISLNVGTLNRGFTVLKT